MVSSSDPDASLFPLVTFRDVRDAIPQPQTVTYRQLAELVAPEQPTVRQDVVTKARKKIDLIDRFERLLRTKGHPDDWTVGNPTWRSLERAHWTGADDAEHQGALNGGGGTHDGSFDGKRRHALQLDGVGRVEGEQRRRTQELQPGGDVAVRFGHLQSGVVFVFVVVVVGGRL